MVLLPVSAASSRGCSDDEEDVEETDDKQQLE